MLYIALFQKSFQRMSRGLPILLFSPLFFELTVPSSAAH